MTIQSRLVRVFISSTFRDFAEERDLLVRKVFPELRRKCRERQVELVDVDLRWGITEEEAQQGRVLPICLAEIDRSRPFFMGFIGERYGWVPEAEKYDLSLIMEQPWLDEHRGGKSVTELEMLHGVLNNPAMEDRAFFYFRDAAYSNSKGGAYLSESKADKVKLEALKDRIRKSGYPVVEDYTTPEALAERVKEDLWKLIDEAFPASEVPDALTQERMRHEAYGASRCRLYLGREKYFKQLDKAMTKDDFKPVLITGQSGGGKSSLVANWVADWSRRHPKASIIVHHLGCGADAADPVRMVTRLVEEIARFTGDEFKPESNPDKQLEQLPLWLTRASAWAQRTKSEFLIVLDGLDRLPNVCINHEKEIDLSDLGWLFPLQFPKYVQLVVSSLDGWTLDASKARLRWMELKVKAFIKAEQSRFIKEYLGRYRKRLTARQAKALQSHPLSGTPLFLLTVLEELRVFGVYEELEQRLATLLSLPSSKAEGDEPTVDDVFERVLARVEADLGKKPVEHAMGAIWASRAGLYQDELLAIAKLVPAQWAAIQNALDESIYESGGKISFGHDYLRKAVEDRYNLTGDRKLKIHRKLVEWFTRNKIDNNAEIEIRGQLEEAIAIDSKSNYGQYFEFNSEINLYYYKLYTKNEVISLYSACLKFYNKIYPYFINERKQLLIWYGRFLKNTGDFKKAKTIYRKACSEYFDKKGRFIYSKNNILNEYLIEYCDALTRSGLARKAINILISILANASGKSEFFTYELEALQCLGSAFLVNHDLINAELYFRKAIDLHITSAAAWCAVEGLSLKEELGHDGYNIPDNEYGRALYKVCREMAAINLSKGNWREAILFFQSACNGSDIIYGKFHHKSLMLLNEILDVFFEAAHYDIAEKYCRELLNRHDYLDGLQNMCERGHENWNRSHESWRLINNLAEILFKRGQRKSAILFLQEKIIDVYPGEYTLYNMARYECICGNHSLAVNHLKKQFYFHPEQRSEAINDMDFYPIRPAIIKLNKL